MKTCTFCREDIGAHAPSCPMVTECWPVTEADLALIGMACMECEEPFEIGDYYTRRPAVDSDISALEIIPIMEIVCLGCGALSMV